MREIHSQRPQIRPGPRRLVAVPALQPLSSATMHVEEWMIPGIAGTPVFPFRHSEDFTVGSAIDLVRVNDRVRYFGGVDHQYVYPGVWGWESWLEPEVGGEMEFVSPEVGLLYELTPDGLAGYYRLSQPRFGVGFRWDAGISPFDLDAVEVHQLGLIARFADGQWLMSIGGFYLTNEFTGATEPSPFNQLLELGSGRGAQIRISGQITNRWSTDFRVTRIESRGSTSMDGSGTWRIPKSMSRATASLWVRYDFLQTPEHQLGMAMGTRLTDRRSSSYEHSLLLPGYSRTDLGFFYERDWLEVRIMVESVLDRRYYSKTSSLLSDPDSPFSIECQFRFRY